MKRHGTVDENQRETDAIHGKNENQWKNNEHRGMMRIKKPKTETDQTK